MQDAWALVEEMKTQGIQPDEFAYTSIINGYKRAIPVRLRVHSLGRFNHRNFAATTQWLGHRVLSASSQTAAMPAVQA